jgi:DNA modification methylase
VPCWVQHFADTDYDQARLKAWMLRDNEEYGEWVPDQLAQLVYEISQTEVPLSLIGFDDDVTRRILMDVSGESGPGGVGQSDDDAGEATEGEADSQRGIVYNLGAHRLMCGDTLDPVQVAKLCAGERISLIFTSPPYADQRTYGGDQDLTPERLARFLDAWAPHCDGPICVNLGIVRKDGEIICYWDDYKAAAERAGLKLFSWNVWDRGQPWAIGAQVAEFAIEHEWVLVFDTKKRTLNRTIPNKSAGEKGGGSQRQPDGTQHRGANRRTAMGIRKIRPFRQLGTVFRSKPEHSPSGHPAAFPVDLPFSYIEAATSEGDIVADPFMGGGTTLVAAARAGRVCLGMEIEPKYVDLARDRYERQA